MKKVFINLFFLLTISLLPLFGELDWDTFPFDKPVPCRDCNKMDYGSHSYNEDNNEDEIVENEESENNND